MASAASSEMCFDIQLQERVPPPSWFCTQSALLPLGTWPYRQRTHSRQLLKQNSLLRWLLKLGIDRGFFFPPFPCRLQHFASVVLCAFLKCWKLCTFQELGVRGIFPVVVGCLFVHKMEHFYIITPIISFFSLGVGKKNPTPQRVLEREKEINSCMFSDGLDTFFCVCALPGTKYLT